MHVTVLVFLLRDDPIELHDRVMASHVDILPTEFRVCSTRIVPPIFTTKSTQLVTLQVQTSRCMINELGPSVSFVAFDFQHNEIMTSTKTAS